MIQTVKGYGKGVTNRPTHTYMYSIVYSRYIFQRRHVQTLRAYWSMSSLGWWIEWVSGTCDAKLMCVTCGAKVTGRSEVWFDVLTILPRVLRWHTRRFIKLVVVCPDSDNYYLINAWGLWTESRTVEARLVCHSVLIVLGMCLGLTFTISFFYCCIE